LGRSEETGLHVHHFDWQFVYILEGSVDLECAGGRKERIVAGDSIFIPGDTPHNETATSDEFQILEVSIPADMGTEPCNKPD
ncbi:MAG: cupin domain-containing protein, partial [Rhodospirillaceae bacterium]|nr:cupin domain-containing protein [Rhodospirillaceae bacterium]